MRSALPGPPDGRAGPLGFPRWRTWNERLVSHHVRQLKVAGLALSQREGKMVTYELTDLGSGLLAAVAAREDVA